MLVKNQKINRRKLGSETTISLNSITDELKGIPTPDANLPKSPSGLRANPGGAIKHFVQNSGCTGTYTDCL